MIFPPLNRTLLVKLLAGNGAAWFGSAVIAFFISVGFVRDSVRAEGVITRMETQKLENGASATFPIVAFQDVEGNNHEMKGGFISPFYSAGQHVPVLFNPKEPTQATIGTFGPIWGLSALFATIGFASFLASLILHRLKRPNE